jgi:hypothetical protein
MFLVSLTEIINDKGQKELFLCIRDLVENGLCLDRFAEQEKLPGRHEATVFLAAWCRRIGLEPEKYREWLVDYSVQVLSKISSTSISQIKHSTKSTIKYVHRSEIPFTCYADKNIFKAACSVKCPLYKQMQAAYQRKLEEERKEQERLQQINQPVEVDPETLPVTKRYKKQ